MSEIGMPWDGTLFASYGKKCQGRVYYGSAEEVKIGDDHLGNLDFPSFCKLRLRWDQVQFTNYKWLVAAISLLSVQFWSVFN